MKSITDTIYYAGVNDHTIDLFEGQYRVGRGMTYNSYVIIDEKIAVLDTVDARFGHEWLDNLAEILGDRKPDYLIVQHMEPDHSANIAAFAKIYPNAEIVANTKTFRMIEQFFGESYENRRFVVEDGGMLWLGENRTLRFVFAPMVHWPEVMVTYDPHDRVLFSADGFGKFGAVDPTDPTKDGEPWIEEARRYYIGIVGKYGVQVQALLAKASELDIAKILPLHGPILTENLGYYLSLYDKWSSYTPESEGIVIAYTSVYGNTKRAVEQLADKLRAKGAPAVIVHDLARCDMAAAVADAFRYSKLVLATTTYNSEIFPHMRSYIEHLTERGFKNRTVALIENGSWAPQAVKIMKRMFEKSVDIRFTEATVKIRSAVNEENRKEIEAMSEELCREYIAQSPDMANKNDLSALFHIGCGLYVVTSNDGKHDNGLIVNTVTQVTNTPNRVAVTINKENYSHHIIKQTGKMNVNCLSIDAPFSLIETFGFHSGRNGDKFADCPPLRSDNQLAFLPKYINAFFSLEVESYVDLDTHGMFICTVTEARVVSDRETMTYSYYQEHVKPKPEDGKQGWVCKVCGWVYEGEELPEDIVCPLCKHGYADFERLN